jgi:hypothetical protein
MSIFDTPNQEAYSGLAENASAGPRLGFQDAMVAAWDMQTKVQSLFAIEKAFGDAERAQIAKMAAAGLRPHRALVDPAGEMGDEPLGADGRIVNPYMDAARSIVDTGQTDVDGQGGGAMAETLKDRDAHIMRERELHPELGLKTYGELFAEIQASAREAKRRDDLPNTIMGNVGALMGGVAGAFNPTTDPLNVMTAPLAAGRTIAARIAAQGGIQGATEGLNVFLNPDTNRLLLGQDLTAGEKAMRIGGAAVGGAALQGLGEGVVIAGRRVLTGKWFNDAPAPPPAPVRPPPEPSIGDIPAPPPAPVRPPPEPQIGDIPATPPRDAAIGDYPTWESFREAHAKELEVNRIYGSSREAMSRETQDISYIAQQLDRWDGPNPNDIPARTYAAVIPDAEPGVRYSKPYTNYIDRMETVDDIARRLDPDLFRTYDTLASQYAEIKAAIERGREIGDLRPNANRPDVKAAFEAERAAREVDMRQQMLDLDYRMRDMAPLVSRVYGAADHEWRHTPVDFATIDFLKRLENETGWRYRGEDKPSLTEKPLKAQPVAMPAVAKINDKVPLAKLTPELEAKIGPNSDAVDRVRASVADNITQVDEKVAQFVGTAKKAVELDAVELRAAKDAAREKVAKAADPEAKVEAQAKLDELEYVTFPDGSRLHLDNDNIVMQVDGGERSVSVRDFLREMDKDQQALQSVMTCSRPS